MMLAGTIKDFWVSELSALLVCAAVVLKLDERVLTFVLMLQVCWLFCLVCFNSLGVFVLVFVEFFTLPYFFFFELSIWETAVDMACG